MKLRQALKIMNNMSLEDYRLRRYSENQLQAANVRYNKCRTAKLATKLWMETVVQLRIKRRAEEARKGTP